MYSYTKGERTVLWVCFFVYTIAAILSLPLSLLTYPTPMTRGERILCFSVFSLFALVCLVSLKKRDDPFKELAKPKPEEHPYARDYPLPFVRLVPSGFDAYIQNHPAVVVHFWAPWNHVDRILACRLETLALWYLGDVQFAAVNVDLAAELAHRLELSTFPTLCFYKSGQLVRKIVGFRPPRELVELVHALVQP